MTSEYKDYSMTPKEIGEYFWFTTLPGNPLCQILSVKEVASTSRYIYTIKKVNIFKKWWVLNIVGSFDSRQAGVMVHIRG